MFKLNNKGMTTAEILVSFILVALISTTIYATVSNYNIRRELESNKLQINTYKNLLTKDIQDDLIKDGLVKVTKRQFLSDNTDIFVADFDLKSGTTKRIVIKRRLTDNYVVTNPTRNYDDYFTIYYGVPTGPRVDDNLYVSQSYDDSSMIRNLTEYPIPDFGYGVNKIDKKVKDLRLTNVIINTDNNTLSLFIGFDHLQLATRYAINIVCPINYTT